MYALTLYLDDDDAFMIPIPVPGRVCKAVSVVNDATIDAETTITLSDGTTTIGAITVAAASVEGTVDSIVFDSTSLGKVEVAPDTPLVVTMSGGATTPEIMVTVMIDEFHGDAV